MPYVPYEDRLVLDPLVENAAERIVHNLRGADSQIEVSTLYKKNFLETAGTLNLLLEGDSQHLSFVSPAATLGKGIFDVADKYEYDGSRLGELNYSITTLIQEVPFQMAEGKEWNERLRYWLYAQSIGALTRTASKIDREWGDSSIVDGLVGVFEDVRDEYKIRVNQAYEANPMMKDGDCYKKSQYQSRLIQVPFDVKGLPEGHSAFMHVLPVSDKTVKTAKENVKKRGQPTPIYLLDQKE